MICNTHPMSNHTPVITRQAIAGGKFRYEVDGVVHTAKSTRLYTHASLYSYVREDGTTRRPIFLHTREDLAVKGSPDAKRCGFTRVGMAEIAEVPS